MQDINKNITQSTDVLFFHSDKYISQHILKVGLGIVLFSRQEEKATKNAQNWQKFNKNTYSCPRKSSVNNEKLHKSNKWAKAGECIRHLTFCQKTSILDSNRRLVFWRQKQVFCVCQKNKTCFFWQKKSFYCQLHLNPFSLYLFMPHCLFLPEMPN